MNSQATAKLSDDLPLTVTRVPTVIPLANNPNCPLLHPLVHSANTHGAPTRWLWLRYLEYSSEHTDKTLSPFCTSLLTEVMADFQDIPWLNVAPWLNVPASVWFWTMEPSRSKEMNERLWVELIFWDQGPCPALCPCLWWDTKAGAQIYREGWPMYVSWFKF
jgi:hypothetical protein